MTFDYIRSRATADRLIADFGQAGSIRRKTVTGGDDFDPSSGTTTQTDYAATLVVLDYTDEELRNTRVLATDKKILIAAGGLAVEPALSDKIVEADGTAYEIVPPLQPLKPAGVVVFIQAQCRR